MGERLRAAVAGVGFIGRVHVRSARLAGADVVGVSASSPQRAAVAARELKVARAFESSDDLVSDDDVDVVHICTPNHLHEPLALAALEAGKHVICEKPLALDPAGAERLVAAARGAQRIATVPFVYRYYAAVREARARVEVGDIGDVKLIHGAYLQDWLSSPNDSNWRVHAEFGGRSRAFADIGSHWCDLVEYVTHDRITHVTAHLLTTVPNRLIGEHQAAFSKMIGEESAPVNTEDAAVVIFGTQRGALGSLVVSQVSTGRKNQLRFEINGSEAALAFDQETPESLWIGRRDGSIVLPRAPELLSKSAAPYATLPGGHPLGYHDCFDAFVAESYEAILNGVPDGLPQFSDGLRTARTTDAVLDSARLGRMIEVSQ